MGEYWVILVVLFGLLLAGLFFWFLSWLMEESTPLAKAIMAPVHFIESVFTSSVNAEDVRADADTPKGIPNDPGRRPPKR